MRIELRRATTGALAGAVAAAVWTLQSPLDERVFKVRYRDEELLGKALVRSSSWRAVGIAAHVANGALLGAAYATVAERIALPAWLRAPVLALAEHLATWPLMGLVERVHPARDELPRIAGDPRAFAQATWRHLLYGVVLGELERLLRLDETAAQTGHDEHSPNGRVSTDALTVLPTR